jgi:tetrapyrrole methylase family protein/MazG family protein
MNDTTSAFSALVKTVRTLRGQNGCPWDRKQNADSMQKYLLAETNELLDAISKKDVANICEELGDLLYIILLLSIIHEDAGIFHLRDVISGIEEKLIRRHPHVFAGVTVANEEELREQWNAIKAMEKGKK